MTLRIPEALHLGGGFGAYQDAYVSAIGRRGLAVAYLTAADDCLDRADVISTKRYWDHGVRLMISSDDLFRAADQTYVTGVTLGTVVLEGFYAESRELALLS